MAVWFMVISSCLIMLFASLVAGILTTVWVGLGTGLVATLLSAQLVVYTKDLIRKTA